MGERWSLGRFENHNVKIPNLALQIILGVTLLNTHKLQCLSFEYADITKEVPTKR